MSSLCCFMLWCGSKDIDFPFEFLIFCTQLANSVFYVQGITAVLNLQRKNEQVNWGINGEEIDNMVKRQGLTVVDVPIRCLLPFHLC